MFLFEPTASQCYNSYQLLGRLLHFAMLRVGHLNVYPLYNKGADVCNLYSVSLIRHLTSEDIKNHFITCNFLQSQSSSEYQLFGITESPLDFRITDHSISIPSYYVRRDPQLLGQTGIVVYVYQSVQAITHRRRDTEVLTGWSKY